MRLWKTGQDCTVDRSGYQGPGRSGQTANSESVGGGGCGNGLGRDSGVSREALFEEFHAGCKVTELVDVVAELKKFLQKKARTAESEVDTATGAIEAIGDIPEAVEEADIDALREQSTQATKQRDSLQSRFETQQETLKALKVSMSIWTTSESASRYWSLCKHRRRLFKVAGRHSGTVTESRNTDRGEVWGVGDGKENAVDSSR